jgi:GH25 family lysozyme M1 (1,4-beta-N-acetylmuramidase)
LAAYFYCDQDTWNVFDPVKHAKWCAQTVEGYLGWTVFFLDIENDDNLVDTEWAKRWLEAWYEETGVTACLYMNQDTAERNPWSRDIIENTPLWVANYNGEPDLSDNWKVIAHQFTDTPVDSDTFFGTAEDWWKLCERKQK